MQFLQKLWKMRENIEIYQACNNQKKKQLFGVRTKLSYNKTFL